MGGLERAPQAPQGGSGRPGGAVTPLDTPTDLISRGGYFFLPKKRSGPGAGLAWGPLMGGGLRRRMIDRS